MMILVFKMALHFQAEKKFLTNVVLLIKTQVIIKIIKKLLASYVQYAFF